MKARSTAQIEKLEPRTLMSAWSTVDSYQLPAGKGSMPRTMASDSAGNVYAAGRATDSAGVNHAVIREQFSASSTWTTIEDTTSYACFRAMTVDGKGDVFVSTASNTGGPAGWIILERAAGQTAFSRVDAVTGGGEVFGLTTDAAGNVFGAGEVAEGGHNHWMVREWKAGTSGFATVDDYIGSDLNSYAYGIGILPSGSSAGIYVVGVNWVPGSAYGVENWFVRKSANGGQTWATVDSFVYGPFASPGSVAYAVSGDRSGNVYVVGTCFDHATNTNHWIVRKSGTGNVSSWSINDDFQLSATRNAGANAVGTDLAGNMYVAGMAEDPTGTPSLAHAIVRSNAGGSWARVDDYQGGSAYGNLALTVDSSGTIYAAGPENVAPNSGYTWLVRSTTNSAAPVTGMAAAVFSSTTITTQDFWATDLLHHRRHLNH